MEKNVVDEDNDRFITVSSPSPSLPPLHLLPSPLSLHSSLHSSSTPPPTLHLLPSSFPSFPSHRLLSSQPTHDLQMTAVLLSLSLLQLML